MIPKQLHPLDRVLEAMSRALAHSPADFTEIAWLERRRRSARSATGDEPPRLERSLFVRVVESGRSGRYRSGWIDEHELELAIRQALARARVAPLAESSSPPPQGKTPKLDGLLFDPRLARLSQEEGGARIAELAAPGVEVDFAWGEGRLVVAHSSGLRRRLRFTTAELAVRTGDQPGAGRARAAARTLEGLAALEVVERARRREAAARAEEAESDIVVLAPEAAATLLGELGPLLLDDRHAASRDPVRWSPQLALYNDGTDPDGLPLSIDLEGRVARRDDLVREGARRALAGEAPMAAGGGERHPHHLFLAAGGLSTEELLDRAGEGVWIGELDALAHSEATHLHPPASTGGEPSPRFVARARGVRRIAGGRLVHALPDRTWSASLDEVFGRLLALGRRRARLVGRSALGGVCAPALAYRP